MINKVNTINDKLYIQGNVTLIQKTMWYKKYCIHIQMQHMRK